MVGSGSLKRGGKGQGGCCESNIHIGFWCLVWLLFVSIVRAKLMLFPDTGKNIQTFVFFFM
jgi:hypothetical protein